MPDQSALSSMGGCHRSPKRCPTCAKCSVRIRKANPRHPARTVAQTRRSCLSTLPCTRMEPPSLLPSAKHLRATRERRSPKNQSADTDFLPDCLNKKITNKREDTGPTRRRPEKHQSLLARLVAIAAVDFAA